MTFLNSSFILLPSLAVCRVEAITNLEQWSESDERHARSSCEGSGERVGRRANESFAEAQPRALIQMAKRLLTSAFLILPSRAVCAFTYRLIKHAGARNGARGKRCDMDGKPEGAIRGNESINVLFLVDRPISAARPSLRQVRSRNAEG